MKITIINIANKMPSWITAGCDEYLKRINHGKYSCKFIEIKSSKNPNKPVEVILEDEAAKISTHIPADSYIIVLDENGIELTSSNLAKRLQQITLDYAQIVFIIGGADGIHTQLKQSAFEFKFVATNFSSCVSAGAYCGAVISGDNYFGEPPLSS